MREYYEKQIHSDQLVEMILKNALGGKWDDVGGLHVWERRREGRRAVEETRKDQNLLGVELMFFPWLSCHCFSVSRGKFEESRVSRGSLLFIVVLNVGNSMHYRTTPYFQLNPNHITKK
jgi:hypothetical protein